MTEHDPSSAARLAAEYAAAAGAETAALGVAPEIGMLATTLAVSVVAAERQLSVVKRTAEGLSGEYVPHVLAARAAAHDIALSEGQFTPFDEASIAQIGEGLSDIYEYLAPFVLPQDVNLPADAARVTLKTFPRIGDAYADGRDAYVKTSRDSRYPMSFEPPDFPEYAYGLEVPVLFDPSFYSLSDFRMLATERADGYADQVAEGWERLRKESTGNAVPGREPLVIRAVGVLPAPLREKTGIDIDFLPLLDLAPVDSELVKERALDARLLVRGDTNPGGDYLKFGDTGILDRRQGVFARGADGKRAPLRIYRTFDTERQADPLSSATPRSQGAITLYVVPHAIQEQSTAYHDTIADHLTGLQPGGQFLMRGLGAASVGVGASTWMGAGKRSSDGQKEVTPLTNRRPVIISMQLFTMA